jgi:hypothetical protein
MTGPEPPRYLPAHWRKRAEDLRKEALTIKNSEIQREIETIARLYEKLAEWVERRMSDLRG